MVIVSNQQIATLCHLPLWATGMSAFVRQRSCLGGFQQKHNLRICKNRIGPYTSRRLDVGNYTSGNHIDEVES